MGLIVYDCVCNHATPNAYILCREGSHAPCCCQASVFRVWLQVDALLARRKGEGEHEALREIKNEFMSLWDGMPRCGHLSFSAGALASSGWSPAQYTSLQTSQQLPASSEVERTM